MSSKLIENSEPIAHFKIFGLTIIQPVLENGGFIDWVMTATEVIAIIYLISTLWKRKFDLSIVLSLIFLFAIFAFTPLCTIINQFIPLWVISRLNSIPRIIGQIYFTLAIFIIFIYAGKLVVKKYPKLKNNTDYKTILYALIILTISAPSVIYINNYYKLVFGSGQDTAINSLDSFAKDYQNILNDNKLVISNDGYTLNALFRIDILSPPYSHDVVESDGINRADCQRFILQHFDYADLKSVGANFVVVNNDERTTYSLDNKPYLSSVNGLSHDFGGNRAYVYKFIDSKDYGDGKVHDSCLKYQQNEKKS
jgi:hypothetical protein